MLIRSLCLVLFLASCEAFRILVVFPMPSKSHSILGHGVVNRLLEAGHEVVHITAFPREKPVPGLNEIVVPNIFMTMAKEDPESFAAFSLKNIVNTGNPGESMFFINLVFNFHKLFLEEQNILQFLGDPKEKFDAVIVEWFFSDVLAGIAPLFQCPLIWFGPTEVHWQMLKLIDGVTNPSYNADVFSSSTPPLSFWQRVLELWTMVKRTAVTSFHVTPKEKAVYNSVITKIAAQKGLQNIPAFEEAVYNGSLLLVNSHPSIGTPFNLPQNAKYVGGYHIDSKVKPLPEDLQKLMDNAKHGVIYFSMGSNLKSVDMSTEMRESLLKMFAKLKQTIIWKFEDELNNVPSNIHLVKWAPQQSIFSHPNLKLFITHGGQLSTTESIHYGVPVIGIPVLGDQFVNMEAVVRKGFGIKVKLADDMAKHIHLAIEEVLSNPVYKQRATEISNIYHDRPVPPGAELVHWVEHVVRSRGAPHLRSPALLLPWYQKMYLDLIVTYVTAFPKKNNPANYRQVDVSDNALALSGDGSSLSIAWVMENPNLLNDIRYLQDTAYIIASETFQNKNFQKLLQDPKEIFDVVISELYETELYAALSALYKCPLIWSYSMGAHWMALRLVEEATNPAFAADYLSPEIPPFDFYGRLHKLWLQIQWSYIKWAETMPKEKSAYEKLLRPLFENRGQALPNYDDVLYNASLILANDYKGNGRMPSMPQNFQFIGGYHVETPTKPLPEDIQQILDNAKHGFIYFSMGSIWQSKDIPATVTNGLLKVFSELKETVIWKYEDQLPNLPKNVHLLKWAPQPSILAHPKCLFFITHGGHLSSIEAVHFGVPTIGIPIFFDQFININKAVANGYAMKVDLTFNLHNDLKTAISNMLANSTFKEKAKELSQIYHDRPLPPGAELVHWVEHVVRTRGAPHLRSPAFMLPWYQKMYMDLAAILITIFATIFVMFTKLFSSRKVNVEKKRN